MATAQSPNTSFNEIVADTSSPCEVDVKPVKELLLTSPQSSVKEIAVQANDFDIERKSSILPFRKRFIPLKFSDYRILTGEDDEDDEQSLFQNDASLKRKPAKMASKRGRGRPRKSQPVVEGPSLALKVDTSALEPTKPSLHVTRVPTGFKCGICGRIFSLRGNAKAHLITHTEERPFTCDFEGCSKRLRTKENLRKHQLSHYGIKMFECSECSQKFCSNASLREHMTRHTGDKPLACRVCGRKFRQVCVLRRHMTTHSQEKPFVCSVCGRGFAIKLYLQSHMKTHTGEKPFSCDICLKKFAHASDVNRHKVTHSGEKRYPCSVCGKRYGDSSSRRRHERRAHEGPQATCPLCSQQFSRPRHLRSHLIQHHDSHEGVSYEVRVVAHQPSNAVINLVQDNSATDATFSGDISTQEDLSQATNQNAQPTGLTGTTIANQDSSQPATVQVNVPHESDAEPSSHEADWTYTIVTPTSAGHDPSVLQLEEGKPLALTLVQEDTFTVVHNVQGIPLLPSLDPLPTTMDPPKAPHLPTARTTLHGEEQEASSSPSTNHVDQSSPAVDAEPCDIKIVVKQEDAEGGTITSENASSAIIAPSESSIEKRQSSLLDSDYVHHPELSSQDYFNWLSAFTEECKQCGVPFHIDKFIRISHVQKTLSDFMASPSGVICDKANFKVLMALSQDLSEVINRHLAFMLESLE